jgi:hypothetical protein
MCLWPCWSWQAQTATFTEMRFMLSLKLMFLLSVNLNTETGELAGWHLILRGWETCFLA